jgi:hypothetical protein
MEIRYRNLRRRTFLPRTASVPVPTALFINFGQSTASSTYESTYVPLFFKADDFRTNKLMLSTLPESESADAIFRAIDCEEGRVLEDNEGYDDSHDLKTFKKGTNSP